jgi:hypothetical protein
MVDWETDERWQLVKGIVQPFSEEHPAGTLVPLSLNRLHGNAHELTKATHRQRYLRHGLKPAGGQLGPPCAAVA